MGQQRLQKVLAAAGVDSRRKCEELILEGAVRVNGKVVDTLPVFVDAEKDVITVRGKKIRAAQKVYFLLNKPKGVICTSSDPQGRKKAIDLVPVRERIYCVGRLDADTTGVIILTNDSELANKLTHPRYGVSKTYVAAVKGEIGGEAAERLKGGIWLAEGRTGRAAVKILKRNPRESLIEITIREGLNRQVRRMLAKVGLPVKSLKRTRIGKLTARGLGVGKFRTLSKAEVAYLKRAAAN
ncbi:MAG: pseudouridine synthase [Planctomycetota bacterium]|jgi:23S rRNA pseudouridine2605 synthase